MAIDAATTMGTVGLTVADLERSRSFYEGTLGLQAVEREDGSLALGAPAGEPLVELRGDSSANALDRRATGLYHLAILVPTRLELARSLGRIAASRWPLDGASDHLVSEALYLSDPDGNGIEVYRDRPREQWRRSEGQLEMSTLPLDLRDVLGELGRSQEVTVSVPPATKIGHVHLQVSDIGEAERFYNGMLGFDVTVRGYPGALFVSAGGYHHHLGLNTWHSAGGSAPPPGTIGLRSFDVVLPDQAALDAVLDRVKTAGIEAEQVDHGTVVRDPSGNAVVLTAR